MRWASSTAASRCTCTRCCKSSITFTRSANCTLSSDKGSRDNGAPALAASRCQANASAILSLGAAIRTCAFSAHSAAMDSWFLARRISSRRSRTARAAPLSRLLSSLKTSCNCSCAGWVASHSRMRAARSPDVAAEKAPPVSASSGCASGTLAGAGVVSGASDILLREKSGNMESTDTASRPIAEKRNKKTSRALCSARVSKPLFSPGFGLPH